MYFSTGNAGPDYNGAYRAGDNLYTSSIVAVDLGTGQYRWHFQQVHHDIWDYDAPNPVVLMDLTLGGRVRKALVEVGKTGFAYILDRATGEPVVGIDEKPAAAADFVRKLAPPFATLHDREQKLVRQVVVPAMPTSYLVGRDGRVRVVHTGFHGDATARELRREIETLLAEKP